MSKLKVLHFPLQEGLGGVRTFVLEAWRHIDHSKFQFDIVTRFEPDEALKRLVGVDGNIYPVTIPYAGNEELFLNQISNIMDNGYDAIHLHTSSWFGGFPLEELAAKKKIPQIIVHAHSSGLDSSYAGVEYERLFKLHEMYKSRITPAFATNYLACSSVAADWIFPECIAREDIYIVKNGIDTQRFVYHPVVRAQYRREFGLEDHLVIGAVGRFSEAKNPEFLLEIFRETHRKDPNARLVWAGTGPLFEQTRVAAADINDAVLFLGDREDVPELLQMFDGFLLPSLFEGLGIAVIEAQTAGLPCLCSTEVPMETKITGNIDYLPLTELENIWAERLLDMMEAHTREDCSKQVVQAGYDVRQQSAILEQVYLNGANIEKKRM